MPNPPEHEEETETAKFEEHNGHASFSWSASVGAATGLVVGIVLAILGAALLCHWFPESRASEFFWHVGSSLLAFVGLIGFAFLFQHLFKDQLALAILVFLVTVSLAALIAFEWVGFPWRPENP